MKDHPRSACGATPSRGRTQRPGKAGSAGARALLLRYTLISLACTLLASCANLGKVEAWEKGNLAKPAMRFDSDPLDARFTQHVYTSKENSSGGTGVGGGGCGCN